MKRVLRFFYAILKKVGTLQSSIGNHSGLSMKLSDLAIESGLGFRAALKGSIRNL